MPLEPPQSQALRKANDGVLTPILQQLLQATLTANGLAGQTPDLIDAPKKSVPEFDQALGVLDVALSSLGSLVKQMKNTLGRQRNAILPLHKLPLELIVDIFHKVVCDKDNAGDMTVPRVLRGVCTRWWEIVDSAPLLWTTISLINNAHRIQVSLERSASAPLYVYRLDVVLSFQRHRWTEQVTEVIKRCKLLECNSITSETLPQLCNEITAPSLRHVVLHGRSMDVTHAPTTSKLFADKVNGLQTLRINGHIPLSVIGPDCCRHITRLSLQLGPKSWIGTGGDTLPLHPVLSACEALESFELVSTGGMWNTPAPLVPDPSQLLVFPSTLKELLLFLFSDEIQYISGFKMNSAPTVQLSISWYEDSGEDPDGSAWRRMLDGLHDLASAWPSPLAFEVYLTVERDTEWEVTVEALSGQLELMVVWMLFPKDGKRILFSTMDWLVEFLDLATRSHKNVDFSFSGESDGRIMSTLEHHQVMKFTKLAA